MLRYRRNKSQFTPGFSLIELITVISILGILAILAIHRFSGTTPNITKNACHVIKGNIEVQAELYYRNQNTWPTTSTLSADSDYFPEGIPVCPQDGTVYQLDATTHQVIGHDH